MLIALKLGLGGFTGWRRGRLGRRNSKVGGSIELQLSLVEAWLLHFCIFASPIRLGLLARSLGERTTESKGFSM
jgi:hypothetical protein